MTDVLNLGAGKGLIVRDRSGAYMFRRIVAGSQQIYISEGDGETGNPCIDVVPGNIVHGELGGLTADANPHRTGLDDLDDVNISAPGDGDFLAWDNGAGKWANQPVSAKLREFAMAPLYIEDPQVGDEFSIGKVANAADIIRVGYMRKGGTALNFNLYIKDEGTPEVAGTKVWSADKSAGTSYASTTSFTAKDMSQYQVLFAKIESATGSPDWLRVEPVLRLD